MHYVCIYIYIYIHTYIYIYIYILYVTLFHMGIRLQLQKDPGCIASVVVKVLPEVVAPGEDIYYY